jgi:integrase
LSPAVHSASAAKAAVDELGKLELLRPWGPNRLRHSAGTRLRREEGLEAARVVLGHARAAVTEIYAEVDHARSREIAMRHG